MSSGRIGEENREEFTPFAVTSLVYVKSQRSAAAACGRILRGCGHQLMMHTWFRSHPKYHMVSLKFWKIQDLGVRTCMLIAESYVPKVRSGYEWASENIRKLFHNDCRKIRMNHEKCIVNYMNSQEIVRRNATEMGYEFGTEKALKSTEPAPGRRLVKLRMRARTSLRYHEIRWWEICESVVRSSANREYFI